MKRRCNSKIEKYARARPRLRYLAKLDERDSLSGGKVWRGEKQSCGAMSPVSHFKRKMLASQAVLP